MTRSYSDFLSSKRGIAPASGLSPCDPNPILFPFQSAIVKWAVRRGRAAIFADCGLGKTFMQIEWARQMGNRALIVAPLAVTAQTISEGAKLGVPIRYLTEPDEGDGLATTNYQRLHHFVGAKYDALVLDESSILKSLDGKTRTLILREFTSVPHRLACTATPAPNDLAELGNHAEFLGIMSHREMSATFFVKDSNSMHWRLKGHAADAFYQWMATWAVYMRMPSDIGFEDAGFSLPPLTVLESVVNGHHVAPGRLLPGPMKGIQERIAVRKSTAADRVKRAAELVADGRQWIVWHGLNDEGRMLARALGDDARLVEGATADDDKIKAAQDWIAGRVRVMVTKPAIFGFGMNFQHCARVAFLGLGDSYEQYYQAIRRCWRFGQTEPVEVHVIVSHTERQIAENVKAKESTAATIAGEVVARVRDFETAEIRGASEPVVPYLPTEETGDAWRLMLGDSAERLAELGESSIGFSVFSPPFVSLYTYTATERDLGNCKDDATFFEHFKFIIRELLRVTMPGRLCACHVSDIPAMIVRDGYIGLRDFRGDVIRAFIEAGWIWHGQAVIDKNPQAQAIRTKSKGLLFIQKEKDSSWLRPALCDYVLQFRKPGENPIPVKTDATNEEWILWAHPLWYDIDETDTLNFREARTDKDERHICPLQLGLIERCIRLWSNPGELVLSPFAGIGSEGYMAILRGRRFVGIELKPEYWKIGCENLRHAESEARRGKLF